MSRVLAIPDIHAPFQHPLTIPFLLDVYKHFECDRVVCLGDEVDWHSLSRFAKDPSGLSAGYEYEEAKRFLKELYKAFPVVQVVTSNHTSRPFRVAYEAGIPEELIIPYKQALEAPDGWSWSEEVVIDGVVYFHGEPFTGRNAIYNAAMKRRQKVVFGHVHSNAGVQYYNSFGGQIWGLNAGCLIDNNKYAFAYGKKYPEKPVLGCGVILHGEIGLFIPMIESLYKP